MPLLKMMFSSPLLVFKGMYMTTGVNFSCQGDAAIAGIQLYPNDAALSRVRLQVFGVMMELSAPSPLTL